MLLQDAVHLRQGQRRMTSCWLFHVSLKFNLESLPLLLKVLNKFAEIILIASASVFSLMIVSTASDSSSTSIISIKHSFLFSFNSTSFFASEKSAISWRAFSFEKYSNCHFDESESVSWLTNIWLTFEKWNFLNVYFDPITCSWVLLKHFDNL